MTGLLARIRRRLLALVSPTDRRMRKRNRWIRRAGCPCGRPATRVRYVEDAVLVRAEIWTCLVCADACCWLNNRPKWWHDRPVLGREANGWFPSEAEPSRWLHPFRPGEV